MKEAVTENGVTLATTASTTPPEASKTPPVSQAEGGNGGAMQLSSKSFWQRGANRLLHLLCRFGPGGKRVRPLLHRLRGVRVGKGVWIGDEVYIDNEFPECVELRDGAMLELRTTILAHTHGPGRVIVGRNAFVGAGSIVATAAGRTLTIGDGAVIVAGSLVNRNVPPQTLYGCDNARPLARIEIPFTESTSYQEFILSLRPLED